MGERAAEGDAAAALAQWQAGDAIWVDELDAPVFAYYWGEAGRKGWQPLRARELAELGLSEDTIRRDLRELAADAKKRWAVPA